MKLKDVIIEGHPLCEAKWIWPGASLYLYNHYADFRKDFELEEVPEKASFHITADYSYRLYVNGRYVCRGPARGYQSHWPFDETDIAGFLRKGHNWLAVEAYTPGISTFGYLHETYAGMICAGEWGDFKIYSDESWIMRRSPSRKKDTARLSIQIPFQEHLDGSKASRDWIYDENARPEWDESKDFRLTIHRSTTFGHAPYFSVEERAIPLLEEKIFVPEKVISTGSGACAEEYRGWENISWPFKAEAENAEWRSAGKKAFRKNGDFLEFEIPASGEDRFNAVVIYPGEYFVGTANVEIHGGGKDSVFDFHFTEGINDLMPAIPYSESHCKVAMGNRLLHDGGRIYHEFYHPLGFRYITVTGRSLTQGAKVKINLRTYRYPFSMNGAFKCADETLNSIYGISAHTQRICALDAYVDTPWREQAQWWGDARVQAKNTFYLDGDSRLLKRGIKSIAGQSTPWGLTYGHAPTSAHNCILPDFSLTWIMTIWDYYWQTGDIAPLKENLCRVDSILEYFDRHEVRTKEGLLLHDIRLWYFGDWSTLYKGKGVVPSFLNMWCLYTMENLLEMYRIAGLRDRIPELEKKTARLRALVKEKLYSPKRKIMLNGLNPQGEQDSGFSVHDQVLAIMLNLVPEAETTMLEKIILPFIRMEEQDCAKPSLFWTTYVFEVLREKGYGAEVINYIKKKWKPMIPTGTTWEHYNWEPGAGGSSSHAWTAHPSYHFVNIISGITQMAPLWKKIKLSPCFIEGVHNAECVIPAPPGQIKSAWSEGAPGCFDVNIELPEGVSCEVDLERIKQTVKGPGQFSFKA